MNKLLVYGLLWGCAVGFTQEADPTLTWGTSNKAVPLRLQPEPLHAQSWGSKKPRQDQERLPAPAVNKTMQSWPANKTEDSQSPLLVPRVKGVTLSETTGEWKKEVPRTSASTIPAPQTIQHRPAPTMESENERLRQLKTPNTWR